LPVAIYSAANYRSGIAASLLGQPGVPEMVHFYGLLTEWQRLNLSETIPG
jgi:hypothetical protein